MAFLCEKVDGLLELAGLLARHYVCVSTPARPKAPSKYAADGLKAAGPDLERIARCLAGVTLGLQRRTTPSIGPNRAIPWGCRQPAARCTSVARALLPLVSARGRRVQESAPP